MSGNGEPTWLGRFNGFVLKRDGCWDWSGFKNYFGYGRLMILDTDGKRKPRSAHRLSWELYRGPIPAGKCILHRCDNPSCSNPDHLFIGTKKDNTQDMMKKGRHGHVTGERHGKAKLNNETVIAVRYAYALSGCLQKDLANSVGVDSSVMSEILSRKTWKYT